jgi:hypothetical protein
MSTPEASQFSKHYSLAEARALLPSVRGWLELLESNSAKLRAIEERLAVLLDAHADVGGELVNQLVRLIAEMKDILQEFASREIQIKDTERGLIDFPSWRDGREIFLCWEKDEPDIEHWHDLESGFAGREPV